MLTWIQALRRSEPGSGESADRLLRPRATLTLAVAGGTLFVPSPCLPVFDTDSNFQVALWWAYGFSTGVWTLGSSMIANGLTAGEAVVSLALRL